MEDLILFIRIHSPLANIEEKNHRDFEFALYDVAKDLEPTIPELLSLVKEIRRELFDSKNILKYNNNQPVAEVIRKLSTFINGFLLTLIS